MLEAAPSSPEPTVGVYDLRLNTTDTGSSDRGLLPPPEPKPMTAEYGATIQVGVFRDRANAERLVASLRVKHDQVIMSLLPTNLYAVTIGPFLEEKLAERIAEQIGAEMHLSPLVLQSKL